MKRFLLALLLITFCKAGAQNLPANFNLIPNSSFEFGINNYQNGLDTDFISNPICWVKANYWGSPIGYFNNSSNPYALHSHTGKYATAIHTNLPTFNTNTQQWIDTSYGDSILRSFNQTRLLEPLIANNTYYFSIYVGLSKATLFQTTPYYSWITVANFGVYFSQNQVKDYSNVSRLNLTPQINFTNWNVPFWDTFVYVKLSGTYVAQGGEQYLTIGNFDFFSNFQFINSVSVDTNIYSPIVSGFPSFILIDDISLVRDTTQPMISLSHFSLGNDTLLCAGDTLIIGGEDYFFHYWWSNGDTTRFTTITQPGTYWCTVDFGCSNYTDTIHILPSSLVSNNLLGGDTVICSGNLPYALTTKISLPNNAWSTGSPADTIMITSPGTYWVTSVLPCGTVSDTVNIQAIPTPSLNLGNDTVVCTNSSFSLTLNADTGFNNYTWSTGATSSSVNISDTGTFWITATHTCGIFTDTIQVQAAPLSPLPDFPDDTTVCNASGLFNLSVSSQLQNVLWSTGATDSSITVSQPGLYWMQAQTACGTITDTIQVQFCKPFINNMQLSDTTICSGECIQLSASVNNYPQQYLWTFSGGNPSAFNGASPPSVCYNEAGTYDVKLEISNAGGTDIFTTQIYVLPQPTGRFEDTLVTIPYQSLLVLPACAESINNIWYRGDSVICTDCSSITIQPKEYQSVYKCVVSNGNCNDSCIYKIKLSNIPSDLWLPDAFTPNGDGLNDYFTIITDNPNLTIADLSVYNRWGERIYTGIERKGWNGTFKGKNVEAGTYFWMLKYKVAGSEETYFKKGDVLLIR